MGKYGHPEFVERLRSYEQNAESILSMEDINKLMKCKSMLYMRAKKE